MDCTPNPAVEDETQAPEPPVGPSAIKSDAADLWKRALDLLQHRMPAAAFASLIGGTHVVEATEDTWTIGVRPHAVQWLSNRPYPVIERTVASLVEREISLVYVADERPAEAREPAVMPAEAPPAAWPGRQDPAPPISGLARLLSFDPNSARGGGFWKMGHYANWFWAAYLGTVAWRVYELVVSGDKRPRKTLWTPPRRFSVSELARAVASGRQRQPNRTQIRGRYRRVNGQRVWQPGAFDLLTREDIARIEWHGGDVHWRSWKPGGSNRPGQSGLRVVYRISVVTSLPLLTPRQVARLPAQNQVEHERYLAERAQDLVAWEQIALPTLAGLDPEQMTRLSQPELVRGHQ